jgi:hypothetical protein
MFFEDSWFSSIKTVCQLWNQFKCHNGGILKPNHSRFPKAWIERTMKDWSMGSHIVLEGWATREGVDLVAIGYKYNLRKSLCFICHKDTGLTEFTDFYEAKWKDGNGNTNSRRVPRPDVMGRYFRVCNQIKAITIGIGEVLGKYVRLLLHHYYYFRNLRHGFMEGVPVPSEQAASAQGDGKEEFFQSFGS